MEPVTSWHNHPITSDKIADLAAALSRAQAKIKPALRDAENPFFKSSYADFESVDAACREALTAEGFSILQPLESTKAQLWLFTMLLHSTGQFMLSKVLVRVPPYQRSKDSDDSRVVLGPEEEDAQSRRPQVMGSAITYYRRYTVMALCGVVAAGDDDDGEATENRGDGSGSKRTPKQASPACPKCGTNASVIAGKAEYGGGWVCWKGKPNKPGCGEKWQDAPKPSEPGPADAHEGEAPPMSDSEIRDIFDGPKPEKVTPTSRRIVAHVKALKLSNETAKAVLAQCGYASSAAVPANEVEKVCQALDDEAAELAQREGA